MGLRREKVVITRMALQSIKEIYEYIKNREKSTQIAHYVRQKIVDRCLELKNFSGYSKEPYLEEYPENYQSVSIWGYVIIFTVRGKEVRGLNVVHSKKHPESRKELK